MSFTRGPTELEERVESDVAVLVEEIRRAMDPRAIVLGGSYGRGEGRGRIEDGAWRALNDYDLWIVGAAGTEPGLGARLADRLGVDHVDIAVLDEEGLGRLAPSQFSYDLREGGRVLWGPGDLLDRIPSFHQRDIPPLEALRILFNRAAGLIGHFEAVDFGERADQPPDARREVQLRHAWTACGDAALLLAGTYDHRSGAKAERVGDAMEALGLGELRERVRDAYVASSDARAGSGGRADEYRVAAGALARTLARGLARAVPSAPAGADLDSLLEAYVRWRSPGGFGAVVGRLLGGGGAGVEARVHADCVRVLLDRKGLRDGASTTASRSEDWDAVRVSTYGRWLRASH